jgi:HSP20 family molecular chaperone IbpA
MKRAIRFLRSTVKNGVLTVTLPKLSTARRKLKRIATNGK